MKNLETLRNEVLRRSRREDVTAIEGNQFSVRNLGNWEVPADEEDDGDYDWKVPTPATAKMFDALAKDFGATWQNDGEKNWITFYGTK